MIKVILDPEHVAIPSKIVPFVHINPISLVGHNLLKSNIRHLNILRHSPTPLARCTLATLSVNTKHWMACYASRFTLNVSSKWYALGFLVYKDTSTSIRFRDKYTYWNLHQINKDYIVWQTLPVWTIAFNMLLIWKYTWQLKMMLTLCLEHTTS